MNMRWLFKHKEKSATSTKIQDVAPKMPTG